MNYKNNYERLAQLIPWKLIHLLKEKNNRPEFWIALYLGTAGLLNDQFDLDLTYLLITIILLIIWATISSTMLIIAIVRSQNKLNVLPSQEKDE